MRKRPFHSARLVDPALKLGSLASAISTLILIKLLQSESESEVRAYMSAVKLDRIDVNTLAQLQRNGRISNVDLAKSVALSPTSCLIRVNGSSTPATSPVITLGSI